MKEIDYSKKNRKWFFFSILLPMSLLAIPSFGMAVLIFIMFGLIGGFTWKIIGKLFLKFGSKSYIRMLGKKEKFLIRFSATDSIDLSDRVTRWNVARHKARPGILLTIFIVALLAQSNINMAATGEGIDAWECSDGEVIFLSSVGSEGGGCEDGSDFNVTDSVACADCAGRLSSQDRMISSIMSLNTFLTFMFCPIITALVAPLVILKDSSLAIVDKKSKSITPIGGKAVDMTNAAMGFGAIVIAGKTLWSLADSASGNTADIFSNISFSLFTMALFIWIFYTPLWISSVRFCRKHGDYVRDFDQKIVAAHGVEVHQLEYIENSVNIRVQGLEQTTIVKDAHVQSSPPIATIEPPIQVQEPSVPSSAVPAQNVDASGYEWLNHGGFNWYRVAGSGGDWIKHG